MSHSRKKTPIFSYGGGSEKRDKQISHKMFRRREKVFIGKGKFEQLPLLLRELMNPWCMSKDGKHYWKEGLTWKGGKLMGK